MKIAISSDFMSSLAKLPKTQMYKTINMVNKFNENPTAKALNYEKLKYTAGNELYSLRVDEAYRCILYKSARGDVYLLLWVDHHDRAYEWAKRHRCAIHPETGSIQILQVEHEVIGDPINTILNSKNIFAQYTDVELFRLGIPEELLPQVRNIEDEHGLDLLCTRLPDEAYEGLFLLMAGDTLPAVYDHLSLAKDNKTIDTEDYIIALENDNSKRRFYVVDECDIDLLSMLSAPLEKWRVFLHPSQRKLIDRSWSGPVRVLGGAGTGKTVVAMHRAKWLAQNLPLETGKILFTTLCWGDFSEPVNGVLKT